MLVTIEALWMKLIIEMFSPKIVVNCELENCRINFKNVIEY